MASIGSLMKREGTEFLSPVDSLADDFKTLCQNYFSTNHLLLGGVSPGVWTLGYAIPYHTN